MNVSVSKTPLSESAVDFPISSPFDVSTRHATLARCLALCAALALPCPPMVTPIPLEATEALDDMPGYSTAWVSYLSTLTASAVGSKTRGDGG
jgi:hypothetical protein